MSKTILQIAVAIICVWLIWVYLLPELPPFLRMVVSGVVILLVILWLLRVAGILR